MLDSASSEPWPVSLLFVLVQDRTNLMLGEGRGAVEMDHCIVQRIIKEKDKIGILTVI